jgi:O-antigen ligase
VNVSSGAAPHPVRSGLLSCAWATWTGATAADIARLLVLAAAALLSLSAAATFEVGFTLTPSYLLVALAVIVGAPAALRGWLALPRYAYCLATLLVIVYLVGVVTGSDSGLPDQPQRSTHRDVVYLLDLIIGLQVVGLAVDLFHDRGALRRFAICLCAGGVGAATYAIYQWPAQHFGLPLADINNALNSDGFTRGHRFQGVGLLGWERVRGTFKEPLFLASYLAMLIPLCIGLAASASRRRRLLWLAAAGVMGLALAFTVSSLAWAALGLALLALLAGWAVLTGRVRLAWVFGSVLGLVVLLAPSFFLDPSILSGVTGRSPDALRATSQNRLNAWDGALQVWSSRPVFGYGPGQSAVRLAYRPSVAPGETAPLVLGSAQGLWAASLVDVGLVGLWTWALLLATLATIAGRALRRAPRSLPFAALLSAGIAVLLGQITADRLDLRVWLVVGMLMAAATCSGRQRETTADSQDANDTAEDRPTSRARIHRAD